MFRMSPEPYYNETDVGFFFCSKMHFFELKSYKGHVRLVTGKMNFANELRQKWASLAQRNEPFKQIFFIKLTQSFEVILILTNLISIS